MHADCSALRAPQPAGSQLLTELGLHRLFRADWGRSTWLVSQLLTPVVAPALSAGKVCGSLAPAHSAHAALGIGVSTRWRVSSSHELPGLKTSSVASVCVVPFLVPFLVGYVESCTFSHSHDALNLWLLGVAKLAFLPLSKWFISEPRFPLLSELWG